MSYAKLKSKCKLSLIIEDFSLKYAIFNSVLVNFIELKDMLKIIESCHKTNQVQSTRYIYYKSKSWSWRS